MGREAGQETARSKIRLQKAKAEGRRRMEVLERKEQSRRAVWKEREDGQEEL